MYDSAFVIKNKRGVVGNIVYGVWCCVWYVFMHKEYDMIYDSVMVVKEHVHKSYTKVS